jgi:hypothetical protein
VIKSGALVVVLLTSAAAFSLPAPLTFFKAAPVRMLTKAQAERLRDVPVRFGADIDGVRYVKKGRPDRTVATCRQFDAAERDGYEFTSNFDNKMSGFLVRACGLLDAVISARPAVHSFVDSPRVGVGDIGSISSAVLPAFPWESDDETARRARRSIAELVREQRCTVTERTSLELRIRCGNMLLALEELLRADIDDDGYQDILVSPYIGALDGTFSYTAPDVYLTRTSPHALLIPHPVHVTER